MFIVPLGHRLQFKKIVVLNSVAREVIEQQRGRNPEFVFTNKFKKQYTIYGTKPWTAAWKSAGLPSGKLISTGVDNLRDTFEYRLRVAKIAQEDIELLKGSTKADALERNQAPAIGNMIDCLEKITERVETTILQQHNVKWTPTPGIYVDKRRLRGRRFKGARLGESAPASVPDASKFELTRT